jgi:hypothetical protein
MSYRRRIYFTSEQKSEIWDRLYGIAPWPLAIDGEP